jgi:valyl-tRNA synthetase
VNITKRYAPNQVEPEMRAFWRQNGINNFDLNSSVPVFSIDTPPPTVSGKLHLGHIFSYSHPDFIARFWRMKGYNVFYPMGFDDNGLPTGRLVEQKLGQRANEIGREVFIEKCLEISRESEKEYREIWERLGLSIDWHYTYRTIDQRARYISQLSFLDLYKRDRVYRKESPTIWCPECQTAIAQAELNDILRLTEYVTLRFSLTDSGGSKEDSPEHILIATTRPELLPACVAIFVHPNDDRHAPLVGKTAQVPIFEQIVPIMTDPLVDPAKGTGIVMCCTFGDQTDISWWHQHKLPLVEAIGKDGQMTEQTGMLTGLSIHEARKKIKINLMDKGCIAEQKPSTQSVRVHERCDTPVEYLINQQWFIRIMDMKKELLSAGEMVNWYPAHMANQYRNWVENLHWDWCISRQRFYGVAFPVWFCDNCGNIAVAYKEQLPVDPISTRPENPCHNCGGGSFTPESDVMDTWATSAMTPQIVGGWLKDHDLYRKVYPFTLRPQAHEIIRTWTFYTIAKSKFHFDELPWYHALISGWGIAAEGEGKISKSRGGGSMPPLEMMRKYSADAVRYWAASTGTGKDAIISEDKIQIGSKLVNKIWNVARFSSRFIEGYAPPESGKGLDLSAADRWMLSNAQELIQSVTVHFEKYDYAAAKAETEVFFWTFADNYLEMIKQRLYDVDSPLREGARFSLYHVLLSLLKLFAPFLPFVTEKIYQSLFINNNGGIFHPPKESIHRSRWPQPKNEWIDKRAAAVGEMLLDIAVQVRRYKSENNLSLGTDINRLTISIGDKHAVDSLINAIPDLKSITRAHQIDIVNEADVPRTVNQVSLDLELEVEP